jgi:hypothetical protein
MVDLMNVFPRLSIHSATHSGNPWFQILGQWIFERWHGCPCRLYKNAFVSIFCGRGKVADDVIQIFSYFCFVEP